MTNPAVIAAFKSKTMALVDTLKLTPAEVVGLGLTLAASHAPSCKIGAVALHKMLDDVLVQAELQGSGAQ